MPQIVGCVMWLIVSIGIGMFLNLSASGRILQKMECEMKVVPHTELSRFITRFKKIH